MRTANLVTCVLALLLFVAPVQAGTVDRLLLLADFDDHALDQPIGTGGPELGEPVSMTPGLSAIVRAAALPTPSLELSHAAIGVARAARFEFFDGEEILHGDLIIRLRFLSPQLDGFSIKVREAGGSAHSFLSMSLTGSGDIHVADATGVVGVIGTYTPGVNHLLVMTYDMDLGSYDIELDDAPVLTDREHGVTDRGIGALLVGTSSLTAPGNLLFVDRIRVVRGDSIYSDDFE